MTLVTGYASYEDPESDVCRDVTKILTHMGCCVGLPQNSGKRRMSDILLARGVPVLNSSHQIEVQCGLCLSFGFEYLVESEKPHEEHCR